jgi:diguanylate cyclase (GGDEF)-like protein/PAS domain S-box-containing protein
MHVLSSRPSEDDRSRRAAVLDTLPDAVLLLDEDLRVIGRNSAARCLERLDGQDLLGAVHPDDRGVLLAAQAEARADGPQWRAPVPVRVCDREDAWHTWTVSASNHLGDPAIRAIVVRARDVTGHTSSADQADTVLREMVATAPVAFLSLDRAGRIRFAGGAGLLFDPQEVVGRGLRDLAETEEQRELVDAALEGERVEAVSRWGGVWWQASLAPMEHDGEFEGVVATFVDVTARTLAEQALLASEAHLRGVLAAVQEALVVSDADGCITSCNPRFRELFGAAADVGTRLDELVDQKAAELLSCADRPAPGTAVRHELHLFDGHGHPLWVLASCSPLWADDGRFVGSVAVLTDITSNKETERRLSVAARTDPVTGVASRWTLTERVDQALARRSGYVALLFCDIDSLKSVNDTRGHATGDQLIRAVARRISAVVRPADTVVRYGGDEFVVVCDELPDCAEAVSLAERIRVAVREPLEVDGEVDGCPLVPTVSIGVATSPPRSSVADLMGAADAAVYAAKSAGRDAVRLDC